MRALALAFVMVLALGWSAPIAAQESAAPDSAAQDGEHEHHDHSHMGHDHAAMGHADHAAMPGMYGRYPMSREASGTAWQPDRSKHEGLHLMPGEWMLMIHGFANVLYDKQGGPRGDEKWVSTNMAMGMASRRTGPGTVGLKTMITAEPSTIGKDGYPLLLQTGETADGINHLIDRQHPHDLFMELGGSYSIADATRSAFVYAALPGEPALGPPAFMHRFSGIEIPESPISHHWLDSTHITFGVVTLGLVQRGLKLEGSMFKGRESDQDRWDIEVPEQLDSHSFRVTFNPDARWSLQASHGRIHSPEQLSPDVDVDRTTVSAMFEGGNEERSWQSMAAWGRNATSTGLTLDAFLLESSRSSGRGTWMARGEVVEKDELFQHDDPRAHDVYTVGKVGVGYVHDLFVASHAAVGLGGYGTMSVVPQELEPVYDANPMSVMVWLRVKMK